MGSGEGFSVSNTKSGKVGGVRNGGGGRESFLGPVTATVKFDAVIFDEGGSSVPFSPRRLVDSLEVGEPLVFIIVIDAPVITPTTMSRKTMTA